MGKISSRISERNKHVKLNGGKSYCLICGRLDKLSVNHVPPRCATLLRDIEQFHAAEWFDIDVNETLKGVRSKTGSSFKTICRGCNSLLGQFDSELGALCETARNRIYSYFNSFSSIGTALFLKCDVTAVMRSVVGHMISATSTDECLRSPNDGPYWKPLRDFVLNGGVCETHDFYCWFYPYRQSLSAKNVSFFNDGHIALVTVLSFYPFSFLAVQRDQGIYPYHAQRISLTSEGVSLDLTSAGFRYARFPFHGLEGNQMQAHHNSHCIVSIPK